MRDLKAFKLTSILLCTAAIIVTVISCYYLRPINFDASRTSFEVISRSLIVYDNVNYRFLMVPFQLPTLALKHIFGVTSPLLLMRVYFFTVLIPIMLAGLYRLIKAEDLFELIIFSFLIFILWLPGFCFHFNASFETAFFFILGAFYFFKDRFAPFFLCALCFSFTHPGILPGVVLMALVSAHQYYKIRTKRNLGYLVATVVFSLLIYVRLQIASAAYPEALEFVRRALDNLLQNYSHPNSFTNMVGVIGSFSLLVLVFRNRVMNGIIAAMVLVALGYFFIQGITVENFYDGGYDYRRIALLSCAGLFALMFYRKNFYRSNRYAEYFVLTLTLALGAQALYFDLRQTLESKALYEEVKAIGPMNSVCRHVELKHDRFIEPPAIPILKLFVDDQPNVESLVYSSKIVRAGFDPCNYLSQTYLPLNYIYRIKPGGPEYTYLYGFELRPHSPSIFTFRFLEVYPQFLTTRELEFKF